MFAKIIDFDARFCYDNYEYEWYCLYLNKKKSIYMISEKRGHKI